VSDDRATTASSSRWVGRGTIHTLLPDPAPEPLFVPVVSVDDHLVEPADLFTDRVQRVFQEAAPRVVTDTEGIEYWQFGDIRLANRSLAVSIVGRPLSQWRNEPVLFSEMRLGSYNAQARLRDMDISGIWASLAFPSTTFGFIGQQLQRLPDPDLALACVRAYNDWVVEAWCAADPARLIPQQIPWMADPRIGAAEIQRNAARGVRAVTFSENPEALGYPSLYTSHWHPFFAACEETGTVVNLHIGSSSKTNVPSAESPEDAILALFPVNALMACVDWIFSQVPSLFPELKIVLSESGISWVPMVMERLRRVARMPSQGRQISRREDPVEVLRRNFYFTSIEDPSGIEKRHAIGLDRIMIEVDYPHPDTSWPATQATLRRELDGVPQPELCELAYGNACRVYRHQPPSATWLRERELSGIR
jgi:predicted TIM-barrel fold metal-dependent hydrolase